MSTAETEIRSTIDAWLAAVRDEDAAAIGQIHAEDGRILVSGSPVISGRGAIADFWKGLLAVTNGTVAFGPDTIEVDEAGAMAFEVGSYSFKTGETANSGNYLVVWKKVGDEWKVCVDSLVAS